MNLTPDYSILFQIVIFLLVWRGLVSIVIGPTRNVLDERARRTVAAQELAHKLVGAAQHDRDTYDQAVRDRRAQLAAESASARATAQGESASLLAQARAAANDALATQRVGVAGQVDAARQRLGSETQQVADLMLARVTGGAG